ncbi:MAG: triose-phosphate isomerase [Candidatus Methylomirabilales bacterium]
MRTPLIVGNWKMFTTVAEAQALAKGIRGVLAESRVTVAICPPLTALAAVAKVLMGSGIHLGAQNMHWEEEGPFTGEVSPRMLADAGCRYVILGHSERRQYFAETDWSVNQKVHAALRHALTPIVCVGETLVEREDGRTFQVVGGQVRGALARVRKDSAAGLVLAYEPVWAIGTGRTATPEQAQEVHAFVRKQLAEIWDGASAARVLILYGGSVKADNAAELLAEPDIDGALVGGASLQVESFARIVKEQESA